MIVNREIDNNEIKTVKKVKKEDAGSQQWLVCPRG